ncbi:aldehyde dehydrogenase family protein [Alicyclobacillus cycloheptanicus]|nr:aldehyde dehydrogenase family protein [Alicyclobacillus cycloheptanicus]
MRRVYEYKERARFVQTTKSSTEYKSFIAGGWRTSASGDWIHSINPADTSDIVGSLPNFTREEAVAAVEAAGAAFAAWAAVPVSKRAAVLLAAADLLMQRASDYGAELTREEGKPIEAATNEVKRAAATFRFYAQEGMAFGGETYPVDDGGSFVFSHREPLGVVSVITPWNFPISIPARKIAPALISGNTVVFKPASDTPVIALRLVECLLEAGLPEGVIHLVTGSASRVGEVLTAHPLIRAITFTGSTEAGESIHRTTQLTTRTQMELGGKNPLIVMEDADLDKAVTLTIKGGFELTGQACTGTSRVIVMRSVYDAYLEKLVEATGKLKISHGFEPGVEVGPLANKGQLETTLSYIDIGRKEGARLLIGGERLTEGQYANGYFVRPAVFADVKPEMRIAQEEIFGPVIAVLPVDSFEEALTIANGVEYGLSAAIVTRDIAKANYFVKAIQAGTVKVNRTTTGNLIQAPFGGLKRSSTSTFRESGRVGLEFFTQIKTVYYGN